MCKSNRLKDECCDKDPFEKTFYLKYQIVYLGDACMADMCLLPMPPLIFQAASSVHCDCRIKCIWKI